MIREKPKIRKNCNIKEWYLEMETFDFKKGGKTRIYGWVTKMDDGRYRAGKPTIYDPETDSDAEIIGIYDKFFEALQQLWKANNPYFSHIYI